MPDLRCRATECVFNKHEDCTADKISIDNNTTCHSFCSDPGCAKKGCAKK